MARIKNLLRNINYLSKHSLWDQREQDIVYLTNKILDDVSYEYNIGFSGQKKINILSPHETLEIISKKNISFIRTGDGEITLMSGKNHSFQTYNSEIAEKLLRVIRKPPENLLVGINRGYFLSLNQFDNHDYYRRHAYELRKFYLENCSETAVYIDASVTCPLEVCTSTNQLLEYYSKWKRLFRGKEIVVICGEGLLNEYKYDIFEEADIRNVINCPRTNAWEKKDEIISEIYKYNKNTLLVFILGQSGKAMITDIVNDGYICWDVGHLAKYYNAVMSGDDSYNDPAFYAPD